VRAAAIAHRVDPRDPIDAANRARNALGRPRTLHGRGHEQDSHRAALEGNAANVVDRGAVATGEHRDRPRLAWQRLLARAVEEAFSR
jgi:hypothetical protein